MRSFLKRVASRLPRSWQQELKRLRFRRQLEKGRFSADELEFDRLETWLRPGDWVLDIGANVGHYTARFSNLVGPEGRVIALEPVPDTFELLAANVARLAHRNVTLLNVAASDVTTLVGMAMPTFDTGLDNYYRAQLTHGSRSLNVLCMAIDKFGFDHSISLVKIDVEGHELQVLMGMRSLLHRDRPTLIVEDNSQDIAGYLKQFDYASEKLRGSCNRIFRRLSA